LNRAQILRNQGAIGDKEFESVRKAYSSIIAKASDMLVELDDDLASQLDAPLKTIETATADLKANDAKIAAVGAIIDAAIKCVGAVAAVAVFIAAPTVAAAGSAAAAIGGVVSTIIIAEVSK
jgi:hypothetical protein